MPGDELITEFNGVKDRFHAGYAMKPFHRHTGRGKPALPWLNGMEKRTLTISRIRRTEAMRSAFPVHEYERKIVLTFLKPLF